MKTKNDGQFCIHRFIRSFIRSFVHSFTCGVLSEAHCQRQTTYWCWSFEAATCSHGYYGGWCESICHCTGDDICQRLTGVCDRGCASGWVGRRCDKRKYILPDQEVRPDDTLLYRLCCCCRVYAIERWRPCECFCISVNRSVQMQYLSIRAVWRSNGLISESRWCPTSSLTLWDGRSFMVQYNISDLKEKTFHKARRRLNDP